MADEDEELQVYVTFDEMTELYGGERELPEAWLVLAREIVRKGRHD